MAKEGDTVATAKLGAYIADYLITAQVEPTRIAFNDGVKKTHQ